MKPVLVQVAPREGGGYYDPKQPLTSILFGSLFSFFATGISLAAKRFESQEACFPRMLGGSVCRFGRPVFD